MIIDDRKDVELKRQIIGLMLEVSSLSLSLPRLPNQDRLRLDGHFAGWRKAGEKAFFLQNSFETLWVAKPIAIELFLRFL